MKIHPRDKAALVVVAREMARTVALGVLLWWAVAVAGGRLGVLEAATVAACARTAWALLKL